MRARWCMMAHALVFCSSTRIVTQLTMHPKYAGADVNDPDVWGEMLRDTFLALDQHLLHTVFRRPSSGRQTQRSIESDAGHTSDLGVEIASAGGNGAMSGRSDGSDAAWGDPGRAFTPMSNNGRTPPHGPAGHPAAAPPDALQLDIGVVDASDGGSADNYFAHSGGISDDEEPFERSGATAVAALILPSFIVTANAGDSRCVLLRGVPQAGLGHPDGVTGNSSTATALPLSEDHKPFLPEEEARIQAAGGAVMRGRVNGELAVSRALGDFTYKDRPDLPAEAQKVTALADIRVFARTKCDTSDDSARAPPNTPRAGQPGGGQVDMALILACDGIWDVMDNHEVADYVALRLGRGRRNMPVLAGSLVDYCLHKDSKDNMTAMVVTFKDFLEALDEATAGLPKGPPGGHPPPASKVGGGETSEDGDEEKGDVYDGNSYPPTPPLYDFGADSDTDDEFMLQSQMSGLDRSGSGGGGYPSDFPSLELEGAGGGDDLDALTPLDSTPCEREEEGGDPLAQTHRWKPGDSSLASMVKAAKSVLATGASSRSATHDGAFGGVRKRGPGGLRPPRGGPTVKAPPGMNMSASWSLDDDIDAGTPRGNGTPLNGSVSDLSATGGTGGLRSRASSSSGTFVSRSSDALSPIHDDGGGGGGAFQNTHFRPSSKRGRGGPEPNQRPSQIARGGPTPGRGGDDDALGFSASLMRVGGTGSPEKPARGWRGGASAALTQAMQSLGSTDSHTFDLTGDDMHLRTSGDDLHRSDDGLVDTPVDRPLSSVSSDSDSAGTTQHGRSMGFSGFGRRGSQGGAGAIHDPSPMSRTQKITMAHHRTKTPAAHTSSNHGVGVQTHGQHHTKAVTVRPAPLSAPSPADSVSQPLGAASIASSAASAESVKHRVRRQGGGSQESTPPSASQEGGVGTAGVEPVPKHPHHVQRRPSSFSVGGGAEDSSSEGLAANNSPPPRHPNRPPHGPQHAKYEGAEDNAPKPNLHIRVHPRLSAASEQVSGGSDPGSAPAVVTASQTPYLEFSSPEKAGHGRRPSDADIQDVLSRYGVTPKVEARRAAHSRRGSRNGTPMNKTLGNTSRNSGGVDSSFGGNSAGVHSGHASTLSTPQNKNTAGGPAANRTASLGGRNFPNSEGGDPKRHFSFSGSVTPSLSARRQAAAAEFNNTKWALHQRQGASKVSTSVAADHPAVAAAPGHRRGSSASARPSRRSSEDEGGDFALEGGVNPPQSPLTTPAPAPGDSSPSDQPVHNAPSALGGSRGGSFISGGGGLRAHSLQPAAARGNHQLRGQLPSGAATLAPVRPVFGGGNSAAARPYEPIQRRDPKASINAPRLIDRSFSPSGPILSGMAPHPYTTRRAAKFNRDTNQWGVTSGLHPSYDEDTDKHDNARRHLGPVRGVVGGGNSPPHLANEGVVHGGSTFGIQRTGSSTIETTQLRRSTLGGREKAKLQRSSIGGGEGGVQLGPSPVHTSALAGFDAGRNASSMPALPQSTVAGRWGGALQLPAAAWGGGVEQGGRKPPLQRPAGAPLRQKVQHASAAKLPPRTGKATLVGQPISARGVQGEATSLAPRPRLVSRSHAVKQGSLFAGGWRALAAEATSPAPELRSRRPSSASQAGEHEGMRGGVQRTRVQPAQHR